MLCLVLAFFSLVSLVQSKNANHLPLDVQVSNETACTVIGDSNRLSVMTCLGEHTLKRETLVATLPKLGKEWTLSLEFKPLNHTRHTRVANIIQLRESTTTRISPEHAGIISIWTHPNHDLHFSSAENVNKSWSKNYNGTQVGQWVKIRIAQERVEKEECLKYRQTIRIDGKEIFRRINKSPQDSQKVKVYASNSRRTQPGVIKNFLILGTGYKSVTIYKTWISEWPSNILKLFQIELFFFKCLKFFL